MKRAGIGNEGSVYTKDFGLACASIYLKSYMKIGTNICVRLYKSDDTYYETVGYLAIMPEDSKVRDVFGNRLAACINIDMSDRYFSDYIDISFVFESSGADTRYAVGDSYAC